MHLLLLLLFSVTLNGRAILDPIGGDALTAHGDTGACIDPQGRCRDTAALGDDGVGIDPHGGVRTSSVTGDKGLGVDPNG